MKFKIRVDGCKNKAEIILNEICTNIFHYKKVVCIIEHSLKWKKRRKYLKISTIL